MKARLAGLVWLSKSDMSSDTVGALRRALTIVPRKVTGYGGDDAPAEPIRCYAETMVEIGVPRAWWFSNSSHEHEYVIDISAESAHLPTIIQHTEERAEQSEAVGRFLKRFRSFDPEDVDGTGIGMGGILQAGTGFGKTVSALSIASSLGVRTLIIVHKEFLLRQWLRSIRKFLPESKVGIVRESKCEIDGPDIVVAMVQSLSAGEQKYPKDLWKWPGLLIVDEVHRVGAPTFAVVPMRFSAQYRLGLTATPRRKDDADPVFWWHIGEIVYKATTKMPSPGVRLIKLGDMGSSPVASRHGISPAIVTNALAATPARNRRIAEEILKALASSAERKIIVLSERLTQLRELERMVSEDSDATTSFYVGEWFTGDVKLALKRGSWPMKDGGREHAVDVIFKSFRRRRKDPTFAVEADVVGSSDLTPVMHDSALAEHATWLHTGGYSGSAHVVGMDLETYQELIGGMPENTPLRSGDKIAVVLEGLCAPEIYAVAKHYKINQKRVEKTKALTEEQLDEAERARVIFATFQMVSEGVDIPALDTEILATPVSDVEQAVGRIRRYCLPKYGQCERLCPWRAGKCQGKPSLVVSDFYDVQIPMAKKRFRYRKQFYEQNKFKTSG